jgi:hypothetical protein
LTVHSKLKQCLNSIESARTSLEGFAQDTQDPQAKQMFTQCASKMFDASEQIRNRLRFIEEEEPQFRSEP